MRNPQTMSAPFGQADDNLELINGVGPAFARALNQIGIFNFSDLTQFGAEELSKMLSEKAGIKVPAERIIADRWIEQAQSLAESRRLTEAREVRAANSTVESRVEEIAIPELQKRRQYAGFSLFFDKVLGPDDAEEAWQTRVYHDESGEEVQIPGVNTDSWVNWILDRAKLPVERQATPRAMESTVSPSRTEVEGASLEILGVHLTELPRSLGDGGKMADAEIRFRLRGQNVESMTASRAPYEIELYMVDLKLGTSELVASERGQLRPAVVEYARRLRIPVSKVGRYEVHTIVQLCPPYETMVHRIGPILNVVP